MCLDRCRDRNPTWAATTSKHATCRSTTLYILSGRVIVILTSVVIRRHDTTNVEITEPVCLLTSLFVTSSGVNEIYECKESEGIWKEAIETSFGATEKLYNKIGSVSVAYYCGAFA